MAGSFLDKIGTLFGGGDTLPWTDSEMIATCEVEVNEKTKVSGGDSGKNESIMRLSWALVHSRHPSDVQRGIAMLEASLSNSQIGALEKREILYLLAVGQFRAAEYARSRRLVDQALKISPDFRQASALKQMIEDKIAKDGMIGVGLAAGAAALLASGIAAVVAGSRSQKK